MESWKIKGHTLEYDDATHTYICDGVVVPSVTQILKFKFGNKYDFVDPEILRASSERGTLIHSAIEIYCKTGDEMASVEKELRGFKFLQREYGFKVLENEVPIILFHEGEPIAAGRLDLVLQREDMISIADIKTTATLDREYLGYQLNLYRRGYRQSYGGAVDELFGVHLRGEKRKMASIPISEGLTDSIIERFLRGLKDE